MTSSQADRQKEIVDFFATLIGVRLVGAELVAEAAVAPIPRAPVSVARCPAVEARALARAEICRQRQAAAIHGTR